MIKVTEAIFIKIMDRANEAAGKSGTSNTFMGT